MYRRGLGRRQIAELVKAAPATVGYHLGIARKADPGLQAEHQEAAGRKPSKVTVQGLERMQQLLAFVQETGRYPSRHSGTKSERTLAAWLQRRRQEARTGALPPTIRDGLAALPAWQTPPRAEADESRWLERLQALARYRATGHEWPRHKASDSGEEHELGVWLHSQRYKLRNGELNSEKTDMLDSNLPGWRVGRKRGRRPLIDG
ncbi:helicase associated domain-containing protein [Arthrobacter sp. UC242_113]|uniref:helicase associated domain-containing protein n=1 Tax=Arthrobacter sp. UC242_113 TaxID=3374550 RepID=UPI0037579518